MRPARKGPENQRLTKAQAVFAVGFNEAGPQGAGKPAACAFRGARTTHQLQ